MLKKLEIKRFFKEHPKAGAGIGILAVSILFALPNIACNLSSNSGRINSAPTPVVGGLGANGVDVPGYNPENWR